MAVLSGTLVTRLYYLQVVERENFLEQADRQHFSPSGALYDRGSIFFENKDSIKVSAATLRSGFILAINPTQVKDLEITYEKINKVVPIDRLEFFKRAGKQGDPYEEIARHLSEVSAEKIQSLKLPGVFLSKERWRSYPGERLAGHAVGFVGYKGDKLMGRYGLEYFYEDTLSREGENPYGNFFAELFSNVKKVVSSRESLRGDIVTTIEPTVEGFLEKELSSIQKKWDSKTSGGIIMDPKTGEIRAMASIPDFNPNALGAEKSSAIFSNPLVESVFEMGSIIKPLTVSAGINAGVITAESVYTDHGSISLDGAVISNFDGKARGAVSMQEVLNQSLNTGAAYIASKLGGAELTRYFLSFGLGEETGIDLPNEAHGLVDNLKSPRALEYATASFGQGIAMTPIATVRALSALANSGVLPNPRLVNRIEYKIGGSKTVSFSEGTRVLKPETAEEVTRMLVKVVDTALLGGTVKLPHWSVAAKTGTAEISKSGGGGYYEDKFLHSFFGYFPAYDPKFIVFLYTIEPKGVSFSSHTLTTPFLNITKFLIDYYEIPSDR